MFSRYLCSSSAVLACSYNIRCDESRRTNANTPHPAIHSNVFKKHVYPTFTAAEVLKHVRASKDVWVTHGDGVYDVTAFAHRHPGGNYILEANGGALEPMWTHYRVHFNEHAQKLLESMRIGTLNSEDKTRYSDMAEPFCNEPVRHPRLQVLSQMPFDGETPREYLGDEFAVSNDVFYVRNHFAVPTIEEDEYTLNVTLPSEWNVSAHTKTFNLDELASFTQVEEDAYLSCAGTRSREITKLPSDSVVGQMGNATWSGARLRDVLVSLGVRHPPGGKWHVHLEGADGFSMSIPLEMALTIHVLLATTMNGEELSRDHGYPCRVIVPGCIGARSIKWITKISITDHESESPWHKRIYRVRSTRSTIDNHAADANCQPCMEWPINSVITSPPDGATCAFPLRVGGVALPSGGNRISAVEVSLDGEKWMCANMVEEVRSPQSSRQWSWSRWYLDITEDMVDSLDAFKIRCRAVDESGATQSSEKPLDYRGLLCNTYHCIKIMVSRTICSDEASYPQIPCVV